jgi:hypothetical protein
MGSKPIFPDMFRKSALMFNIFCTKKVRFISESQRHNACSANGSPESASCHMTTSRSTPTLTDSMEKSNHAF